MSTKENVFAVNLFVALLTLLLLVPNTRALAQEQQGTRAKTDLTQMSLEELMNVQVASSASLTKTTKRLTPAAVTTITQEDIQASGARNLDELLDIYVPNFEYIRHPWEFQHAGLRGIIADRDPKYLLLVNGRMMNEIAHQGALSERDLPMLTDIHHVEVIRGPGSAMYGPGAISMVINIITESAKTFEGTEVTGRLGGIEEFYSGEFKYGKKFKDDSGIFLYGGTNEYLGADAEDAPYVSGRLFKTQPWDDPQVPENHSKKIFPTRRDGEAYNDQLKNKLYGEYTNGGLDIWARYTRGGEFCPEDMAFGTDSENTVQIGYQQATGYIGYTQDVSKTLTVDYSFSSDMTDFVRLSDTSAVNEAEREEKYYSKVIARWVPNEHHSIAFGGEWQHDEFGLRSSMWPHSPAIASVFVDPCSTHPLYNPTGRLPRWSTDMYSLLGEYQLTINDQWTTFVGGRMDDHSMTNQIMFSPRAAVVYMPTEKDTLKVMYSKSVRTPAAEDAKLNKMQTGEDVQPEKLAAYEFRYERQQTKELWLAGSLFYHDQDIVTAASGVAPVGNLKSWGAELEAIYRTPRTTLTLSHGFTKQIKFNNEPGLGTFISASAAGYGNDLANWSNNVTKLTGRYDLTDKWSVDGSLRVYWDFPGQKDYAKYVASASEYFPGTNAYDLTYDRVFGMGMLLNLGAQYKPNKNLTVRLDGYNLLGLVDHTLNKRLIGYDPMSGADYRAQAPAFGVSLSYKF